MTDRELDQYKKFVNEQYPPEERNDEDYKALQSEIRCREMANSIICYHALPTDTARQVLDIDMRGYHSYLKDYVDVLGEEAVLQIIQEQLDDIEDIQRGVMTDSEGCSYNSIVWKRK